MTSKLSVRVTCPGRARKAATSQLRKSRSCKLDYGRSMAKKQAARESIVNIRKENGTNSGNRHTSGKSEVGFVAHLSAKERLHFTWIRTIPGERHVHKQGLDEKLRIEDISCRIEGCSRNSRVNYVSCNDVCLSEEYNSFWDSILHCAYDGSCATAAISAKPASLKRARMPVTLSIGC